MKDRDMTNEDLCADCCHASLLEPKRYYTEGGSMWHAKAVCAAGWPYEKVCVQANAISDCKRFIPRQQSDA